MHAAANVYIYGDSLMKGTVIDDSLRYHATMAARLERLQARFGLRFQNRSRFGITAQRGLRLMEKDLAEKTAGSTGGAGGADDYAVIEFGGNDCDFNWAEVSASPAAQHAPFSPLDDFSEALMDMAALARRAGMTPVMMSLPPIDAERYLAFICRRGASRENILRWLGDAQMIYRFHELYSRAAERVARDTGALLVDVRDRFLGRHGYRELIGLDGIHLTTAGYEVVYEAFEELIEQLHEGGMAAC